MKWSSSVSEEFDVKDAISEVVGTRGPTWEVSLPTSPSSSSRRITRRTSTSSPHRCGSAWAQRPHRLLGRGCYRRRPRGRGPYGVLADCGLASGRRGHSLRHSGRAPPRPRRRPLTWETAVGVTAADEPHFVLLADPFSLRADALIAGLDYAFPSAVKIGDWRAEARGRAATRSSSTKTSTAAGPLASPYRATSESIPSWRRVAAPSAVPTSSPGTGEHPART